MGWSNKYKKSIDCNNPKGFSQKAHCQGRKKRKENTMKISELKNEIKSMIQERSINAIAKAQQKNADDIARALELYKKAKGGNKSYNEKNLIKVLKKLGQDKKKLEKEMDVAVSSKLKDVGYAGPLDEVNISKDDMEKLHKDGEVEIDGEKVTFQNEAMKPSQVRSAIERMKKVLMKKWQKRGGYENFGQRELDVMKDKLNYNPYGTPDERKIAKMLDGLDNWAMNYDGSMRENEKYRQLYYTNESTGYDSNTGLFYLSGVPFTRERVQEVIRFFQGINVNKYTKSAVNQFEYTPSLLVKDKSGREEVLIDSKKLKMLVSFYKKNSAKLASDKDF